MSKIDAKVVREGKKGVMLQIKAINVPDFGNMKCQIDYHLDSEEMADAIEAAAREGEKALDGMDVDPTDDASVGAYVGTCGEALIGVMNAVKEQLNK
jgi:hypothetical protein